MKTKTTTVEYIEFTRLPDSRKWLPMEHNVNEDSGLKNLRRRHKIYPVHWHRLVRRTTTITEEVIKTLGPR